MRPRLQTTGIGILYFLLGLLIYWPTAGAGFVTDQIGWLNNYRLKGWMGLFNAFGDQSLHYVYHLFGFTLWKMFGLNGYGWMTFFVGLHAAVAAMCFHVFRKLWLSAGIKRPFLTALGGSALFFLSPYQTEVLVWYACVHYLVCSLLLLLALNAMINYATSTARRQLILYYLYFFCTVFTLEISFTLPLIAAVFIFLFPFREELKNKLRLISLLSLPPLILVGSYFMLSKILRGNVTGHYGAATHFNFDIPLLVSALCKYFLKIFTLSQFWPYEWRQAVYTFCERSEVSWILFLAILLLVLFVLLRRDKLPSFASASAVLIAAFALALAPVLNLFFYHITPVEGDRFSYFASIFGAQLFALCFIASIRYFGPVAYILALGMHLKFLLFNTESWNCNRRINDALVSKFRWQDAQRIFILNIPDNFRGTYMFRSFAPDNYFRETLKLERGIDMQSRLTGVMEYNMNGIDEGVSVDRSSDNELRITFNQWGNWWWQKGIGANDYSTTEYSVKLGPDGHSYLIRFYNKSSGTVYLYQSGAEWKVVEGF